jgi:hypothetical protein
VIQPLGGEKAAQDGVRRLFFDVFGHEVSAGHWSWKYGPGAAGRALNLVAVGPQGTTQPWGHVGACVMPGRWCGLPARLAHLTDVMVHPGFRGNLQPDTLYSRLMRTMAKTLVETEGNGLLAWGFPGLSPARLGARMGLYRPLQRVSSHHVDLSSANSRSGLATPWSSAAVCKVQPQAWDPNWLNQIWQRVPNPLISNASQSFADPRSEPALAPLLVQKDAAYCLWRYRDHPGKPYTLWRVKGPWRQTLGWLVTRTDPLPLVVDALVPRAWGSGRAWSKILNALAVATGCPRWTTWNPPDPDAAPVRTETSLIVPVEFLAGRLVGAGDSAWTHYSAQSGRFTVPAATPWQPPWFQPGDTDVF